MKFFRQLMLGVLLLLGWGVVQAQAPNLTLTLRYNNLLSRYEVYALPTATQPNFFWGPSQISIVAPASLPDVAFVITSVSAGAWQDNSLIFSPAVDPTHDYHGVGSLGAPVSFTSGVEKLIFHFTLPGGCTSGLRLFVNGTDPDSSQPGMGGGDFSNTVFGIVLPDAPAGYEAYTGNYNNTGTFCNLPPDIVQPPVTTPEETPVTMCPTLSDPNIGDILTMSLCDMPDNGMAVLAPGNCVTYTPNMNFVGQDTVCIRVCDQLLLCDTVRVPITVTPVNDPPVVNNDTATTPEDTPVTITVLSNDTDVDGTLDPATVDLDPSTPGVQTTFTVPGQGTFTVNPVTGVVTFTPVSNFNGPVTPITYIVCDNGTPLPALCDDATITVTVTPVNDPPVANNDTATTPEDTPVTIPVLTNDTDTDGTLNPATVDLDPSTPGVQTTFTVPGQGTFTVNPVTGIVTFTPVLNFNGPVTPITYIVCDNGTPLPAQCDDATITVTVTPVNDPPVANNDTATTPEDTPVTIPILANDTDVDGTINPATIDLDVLTPGIQTTYTAPGQGTYTVNPVTGIVTFTPVANFNGTATPIIYNVCDTGTPLPALCDDATITVTVTPVNDAPVANNDTATTPEDTPVTIPVLANDTDTDGTLDPATVDLDPSTPGVQTTFTVPGQGTFTVNPVTGVVTFTPVSNFNGPVTPITYIACDTGTPLPAQCDDATITVTVTPVNDTPVANNDTATTPEDTPVTIPVLANDTDVDGMLDPATVDLNPSTPGVQTTFTVPGQGTFTVNPVTGVVTFTPVSNFNGPVTPITYIVCDNGTPLPAQCDDATITVTVTPVNDAPVANNDTATTPEDTPVTIPVLSNDTDTDGTLDPATVDLDPSTPGVQTTFTVPGQGTFTVNPVTGVVTFTPVSNFNGPVTPITYIVCDNGTPLPAQCDDATITVTVTPVNDAPVANNDTATTPEDTPVTIPVLANDTDTDGMLDPATVDLDPSTPGVQTTFTVPGQGTFTVNPVTGVVTFTPVANFNGPVTPITYIVCDNGTPLPAQCDDATITVTVTTLNDSPVANNDTATTPEDTPVTIPVLANDTDTDGMLDPATVDLDPSTPGVQTTFTVPGQGTFTVNPVTGVVTFTPVSNFNGPVTPITYIVCDNGTPLPAQCDDATITVTVTPVNDPPVVKDDSATTPEDTPVTIPVLANDTDVDGTLDPATVDLDPSTPGVQTTFTVPGQGTFTVNPVTGVVTFTPVSNFNGPVTPITYIACDTGTPLPALCAQATITVTVTPVNDAPVANNDTATTPEDTPVTIPVLSNDTDVDGTLDPATVDLDPLTPGVQTTFTVPGQGTFTVNPVTGVVTFTPVSNFNGPVTPITYVVCDNGTPLPAQCDDATITVTVTTLNDAPVANNDTATTPEDTPVTIPVLANDTDTDGMLDPATVDLDPSTPGVQTTFTVPGQGTFTVNPVTGVVTFTPVSNFNGPVTPITYVVCDNGTPLPAQCDDATITVTVTPVNDPPVAVNDVATTPEDMPVTIPVLANDSDVDGTLNPATLDLDPATPGVQTSFTVPNQGTFVADPVTGEVVFTPVANYSGTTTPITYSICDNGTPLPAQCAQATITVTVIFDPIARLNVKVLLQGALYGTSNGLMRDELRTGGYLPLTEPYTAQGGTRFGHVGGGGGETTTPSVLATNAGTPNAIVDWVFVELRSVADSSVVVRTVSALLQRDGDVVSPADGMSPLTFNGLVGQQFFISVKHRNHMGVMTATEATMTNDGTIVDFTTASNASVYNRSGAINYDGFEMVTVGGLRALWAGNANADGKVKYQGPGNDNVPILTQVITHPNNSVPPTYNFNAAFGYYTGDVNLDGKVKYQGTVNDPSFIFSNIIGLYNALNTMSLYNYDLMLEQLP